MAGLIKTIWSKYRKMHWKHEDSEDGIITLKEFRKCAKELMEHQRLLDNIDRARIEGDFLGTIEGVLANEIPDDLRGLLEIKLKQINKIYGSNNKEKS